MHLYAQGIQYFQGENDRNPFIRNLNLEMKAVALMKERVKEPILSNESFRRRPQTNKAFEFDEKMTDESFSSAPSLASISIIFVTFGGSEREKGRDEIGQ